MSVFISYNHNDSEFAERLALELARNNIKVWKDSWRIGVGDSLIQKIQSGLEGATFFCVLLSKNSLASEWVTREITVGLLREIEERKVIILPVIIDDCKIPLLIRDKLYADFRTDFDQGLRGLLARLLPHYRIQSGGRIAQDDKYYVHFTANTTFENDRLECAIDAVSFDLEETYSILTQVRFLGAIGLTQEQLSVDSLPSVTRLILEACSEDFRRNPAFVKVVPGKPTESRFPLQDGSGGVLFEASCRLVGLGEFRSGAVVFNFGELVSQVADSLAVDMD